MASQQELVNTLADLLNEILEGDAGGAHLVRLLWVEGDGVSLSRATDMPEDLIARVDGNFVALSAMGILNTALVRLGGEGVDRLIAVEDDKGTLIRFEVGVYPTKKG